MTNIPSAIRHILFLLLIAVGPMLPAHTLSGYPDLADNDTYGYLYVHESAHGGWPAYALSRDGLHFHDLLCGDSIFPAELDIRLSGYAPFLYRAHGGGYLLVVRSGPSCIDIFRSEDLVEWVRATTLDLTAQGRGGNAGILWDGAHGSGGSYLVYFPMPGSGRTDKYQSLFGLWVDEDLLPCSGPQLLADWGSGIRDAGIYPRSEGGYQVLFQKEENSDGFFVATAESLSGPWSAPVEVTPEGGRTVEGPTAFRLAGTPGWQVGYAVPDGGPTDGYRICAADESFADMQRPQYLEGVYGPGKGSFLRITETEYNRLQAWSDAAEPAHLVPSVHNPVFPGLHADPEALYSEQTGRYYIYPTTDGAFGWHNHDFKCFSSSDLVHWKDEGVILDLQDLDWGKEYAWAPCIIEKSVGEGFKYYFYFVANKSIGVAVADRPEGPYHDALGRPLLSQEEICIFAAKKGPVFQ